MADKQETIADVLAAMRDEGRTGESSCLEWVGAKMRHYADRIEAAHKRERGVAVTCSNQLREALVKARRFIDSSPLVSIVDDTGTIARGELCAEIDAALAAPVKNCEVGTAMEQGERFSAYCRAHKHPKSECLPCPLFGQTGGYCELAWAQMPYEEGGAK